MLLMTLLLATLAHAGEGLTLTDALEAARHAPDAALAEVDRALGEAERAGARVLQNPSVAYQGYGRTRGSADAINGQQHQIDVAFALPITGELAARWRRGSLASALGQARAETRLSMLGEAVGVAWLDLLVSQQREQVLASASTRLSQLVERTRRRAQDGAARPWDVDRLRLAEADLLRRLAGVRQERLAARARLAVLLGEDAGLQAEGVLAAPLPLGAPPETAEVDAPFVQEARAELGYADAGLREARRARLPEPGVFVGTYVTTDGDSSSVVAGVAVDVPIFDLGRGRVLGAQAERHGAEAQLRRAEAWVQAERSAIARTIRELEAALAQTRRVPGSVAEAAEVAWREGEASVFELVDAVNAEVESELATLDLHRALRRAELRRALLSGALARSVAP